MTWKNNHIIYFFPLKKNLFIHRHLHQHPFRLSFIPPSAPSPFVRVLHWKKLFSNEKLSSNDNTLSCVFRCFALFSFRMHSHFRPAMRVSAINCLLFLSFRFLLYFFFCRCRYSFILFVNIVRCWPIFRRKKNSDALLWWGFSTRSTHITEHRYSQPKNGVFFCFSRSFHLVVKYVKNMSSPSNHQSCWHITENCSTLMNSLSHFHSWKQKALLSLYERHWQWQYIEW